MKDISLISSLAASVFLTVMALFVIIKDWKSQVNRYYFVYNLGGFGILFTMFLTFASDDPQALAQINRVTQASTVMFFASFFTMSLVFPKSEKRFPLYISILILLPAMVIALIAVFTELTISKAYFEGDNLIREFRPFYTVYAAVAFTYLLAGMINFIIKYFRTKVDIYRLQMRYLFVGTSVAIALAAVCSIILPRVFNYSQLYVIGPSAAAFVATFFLFYSVIAYNLMDITTAIHKTVMYFVMSLLIFLPVFGLMELYKMDIPFLSEAPYEMLAGAIVGMFILFSVYIQPVIDKLFKRRQYAFEGIVDQFIFEMEKIKELSDIIKRIVELINSSLGLKGAAIYFFNEEARGYQLTEKSGGAFDRSDQFIDRNSPVVKWFLQSRELTTIDRLYTDEEIPAEIRRDVPVFFSRNSIRVAIPFYHNRRLVGILCLAQKETASGFSPSELKKLEYFQRRSGGFISAAITYQRAMHEQMVSRTIELSTQLLEESIPPSLPVIDRIKFGAFIVPKYEEGADYFDFVLKGKEGVGFISADVSGIGINSAFYNVILRAGFHSAADDCASSATVMQNLNRLLYDYSEGRGGLITAYYVYVDLNALRMYYTNAGYPGLELFRIEKNNFDTLDTEGIPLGYSETADYGTGRTNLLKGDIGLLYSKSLTNSKNQNGELFNLLSIRGIISDNRSKPAQEIANSLKKGYEKFMGILTPESDIVVIVFKI